MLIDFYTFGTVRVGQRMDILAYLFIVVVVAPVREVDVVLMSKHSLRRWMV